MIEYNKRLVEVDEILKHLSQIDYNKIPEEIKEIIETNKDKNYIWNYDNTKKLEEQDVPDDTIAILSYINMEYLLNEKQKKAAQMIYEQNEKNRINNFSYNTNIFNKKSNEKNNNNKCQELSIEKKKQSFLQKLNNYIKNLFRKNL